MFKQIHLILGCNGSIGLNGFVCCNKLSNTILTITPNFENINEMLIYFKSLNLHIYPLKDYNAVRRVLFNLNEKFPQNFKPIWDEKYFHQLEEFTINHKKCGIYLKIIQPKQ